MSEYKYNYRLTQIVDEEGTLKFLANYKTNELLTIGTQIATIIEDEDGRAIRRLYFEVKHIVQACKMGDVNEFLQYDMDSEAQVILLIDEPILYENP